jgi:hypothetical protein
MLNYFSKNIKSNLGLMGFVAYPSYGSYIGALGEGTTRFMAYRKGEKMWQ